MYTTASTEKDLEINRREAGNLRLSTYPQGLFLLLIKRSLYRRRRILRIIAAPLFSVFLFFLEALGALAYDDFSIPEFRVYESSQSTPWQEVAV